MYQQALTPRPVAAIAEEGLGAVSLEQGSPAAAVSHLDAAVRASPDSPSALNLPGVAHGRLGHADQAASLLRRAVEKRPDDVAIRVNLALAEEHLGRHKEAILQYGEALRLNPSDAQACPGIKRLTGGLVRDSRVR